MPDPYGDLPGFRCFRYGKRLTWDFWVLFTGFLLLLQRVYKRCGLSLESLSLLRDLRERKLIVRDFLHRYFLKTRTAFENDIFYKTNSVWKRKYSHLHVYKTDFECLFIKHYPAIDKDVTDVHTCIVSSF